MDPEIGKLLSKHSFSLSKCIYIKIQFPNVMAKGKLIVLDGTDGCGKKTQTDILVTHLKAEGHEVGIVDFPQYKRPSAIQVENCLNGVFGDPVQMNPYAASLPYAFDRFVPAAEIQAALDAGEMVVSNRYTSSNVGHQGSKIIDEAERRIFLEWLLDLEFNRLGIPEPDLTFFLHVPIIKARELVDQKAAREYIEAGTRDGLEDDLEHQKRAEAAYYYAAELYDWPVIECSPDGTLMPPEEIHKLIWAEVKKIL